MCEVGKCDQIRYVPFFFLFNGLVAINWHFFILFTPKGFNDFFNICCMVTLYLVDYLSL